MTLHYISKHGLLPVKACPDTSISGFPEKRLGIQILKNLSSRLSEDFDPLIVSVQRKVNLWLQWDLSITGRSLVAKVEGFS